MKIGICQLNIIWEDKEATKKKVEKFLKEAKAKEADIVFFPEMTLTGFSMHVEKTRDKQYGDTIGQFQHICREIGIGAGFGWVEGPEAGKENKKAKNHYTIVDDAGVLLSDYVKIHPFSYGAEAKHFEGGNQIVHCEYKGHKIGTAICYDLRFPELFRLMESDCSLFLIPANWPAARSAHWRCLLQARAIENQVYVAGINCVGQMEKQYYSGNSMFLNPLGESLGELVDEEGLLLCDISNDVEKYRTEFPVRKDQKIQIRKMEE